MRTTRLSVKKENGLLEIAGDLDESEVAFVDADWIPGAGPLPAVAVPEAAGAADMVARALARTALAAARTARCATEGDSRARIHVTGAGVLASLVIIASREAQLAPDHDRDRPRVVIETTGRADVLASALRLAADLGTVILAGETAEPEVAVDLYGQVHRRGLRVVGTPLDATGDDAARCTAVERLAADALRHLQPWNPRLPIGQAAWWYRIDARSMSRVRGSGRGPDPAIPTADPPG